MAHFLSLLLIFSLISVCSTANITRALITQAAKSCCPRKQQACCEDTLLFGKPLACGFEKDAKIPKIVYACLQNELFAEEPEKRTDIEDAICCSVFGRDANDPTRRCESLCIDLMKAPSVDAATRTERIRNCNIVENPLFTCFESCKSLKLQKKSISVLQFSEYCNQTLTWKRPLRRHRRTVSNLDI